MQTLYQQNIMDRYHFPRHKRKISCDGCQTSKQANPACGDQVELTLRIENGRISEAAFTGTGCILSLAAADMLIDRLLGQPVEILRTISVDDIKQMIGIPVGPTRIKCILLPLQAAQQLYA